MHLALMSGFGEFFVIDKSARIVFLFGNFKAIYDCRFVYFVDALLQLVFCCMHIFISRGNAEVINEQVVINSSIQAIGNKIDFYAEEGY